MWEIPPFVLVGCKSDLKENREVEFEEALQVAFAWQVPYFECSAKTRLGVEEPFHQIIREINKCSCGDVVKVRKKKDCRVS